MTWRKGGYGQPRVRTGIRPGHQGRHSSWVTQRVELIRKIREELTTKEEAT